MSDLKLIAEPYPSAAWKETVVRGVDQHNVAATGLSDYYPVGFFIKSAAGEVLGGLLGDIWGGWMVANSLWVHQSLRGRGYGAALMAHAHRYALKKNCTHAALNAGSYEARPFYEKLGYRVYAELKNHPVAPHSRYFLSRRLDVDDKGASHTVDYSIAMDPYPSDEVRVAVRDGIGVHAHAAIGLPEREISPHNYFLCDAEGEVLGGLLGNIWGAWMYVSFLWVDRSIRGHGHASRLMTRAEEDAITKRCGDAFLGTFSFQARPLYEKLGYHVFGEERDHQKGHSHYRLTKRLDEHSSVVNAG